MNKNNKLFWTFLVLLVIDLIVPDPLPFADELLLSIATTWYGIKT